MEKGMAVSSLGQKYSFCGSGSDSACIISVKFKYHLYTSATYLTSSRTLKHGYPLETRTPVRLYQAAMLKPLLACCTSCKNFAL